MLTDHMEASFPQSLIPGSTSASDIGHGEGVGPDDLAVGDRVEDTLGKGEMGEGIRKRLGVFGFVLF